MSTQTTVYASVAVYTCTQEGYELIGQATRTCIETAIWNGIEPFCQSKLIIISKIIVTNLWFVTVIDCGPPDLLTNTSSILIGIATLQYTATVFNSTALYSCDTGYYLVGETTRVCQSNKSWSYSAPSCICEYIQQF